MKIKVSDVKNLIKEEFEKMREKHNLTQRLKEIDAELKSLNEGYEMEEKSEEGMEEVKVKGHSSGSEYYEKDVPTAEFEKLQSKEGEATATIKEDDVEMGVEDIKGDLEVLAAELGKALDKKFADLTSEEKEVPAMENPEAEVEMGAEVETDEVPAEEEKIEEKVEEVVSETKEEDKEEVKEEVASLNESVQPTFKNKILTEEAKRWKKLADIDKGEDE